MVRAAKPLVIAIFSLLWLIVSIMRVPDRIGRPADIGIDTSWVLALPETLHQNSISGRDFHFTYGPLSQVLAYSGALLHSPWSVIDSLPLIMLAFYSASIVLLALILWLLDFIDWKQCAFIYVGVAALNLFSEPTAFRPLALMFCAVLFYRALRAKSGQKSTAWSIACGLACFAAQLLTFELGIYSVATVGISALRRNGKTRPLAAAAAAISVYIAANLGLSLWFSLSSQHYRFFDYQRYALETVRGFSFSQGLPWELSPLPTMGIAAAGAAAIALALLVFLRDINHGAVLVPLLACSLIQLKSFTVRSDVGHITQASSPLVFVLLLSGATLLFRRQTSKAVLLAWAAAFTLLWFSWPWSGAYFASDLLRAATKISPIGKLSTVRTTSGKTSDVLPDGLAGAVQPSASPLLAFPYQNYIPVALQRRLVAPVLMSYNAATEPLQQLYIESLGRETDLQIVYGEDGVASTAIDEVQAITRVPAIFDYLYKNFRLRSDVPGGNGYYILERDATSPRGFQSVDVAFNITQADKGTVEIRPTRTVTCGLLRLNVQMGYGLRRHLGRPTPVELLFIKDGAPFLKTVLTALKPNAPFSTYVSLMPAERFHELFGAMPGPATTWDSVKISARASDWLGVAPHRIDIRKIECIS